MITFLPAFLSLAVMVRVPATGVEADDAQVLGVVVPQQWLRPRPTTTYTQVSLVAPLEVLRVVLNMPLVSRYLLESKALKWLLAATTLPIPFSYMYRMMIMMLLLHLHLQLHLLAPMLMVTHLDLLLLLLFTLLLLRQPTLPDATFKTFPPPCTHP